MNKPDYNANLIALLAGLLLSVLVIVVSPFIIIWALNALFNTGIDVSFDTYFAALFLSFIFKSAITIKKD